MQSRHDDDDDNDDNDDDNDDESFDQQCQVGNNRSWGSQPRKVGQLPTTILMDWVLGFLLPTVETM